MGKTKGKKKKSKKPTPESSNSNGDTEPFPRKPKMPFEVNAAQDLREHTVDELIALTRATDKWTDEVKKWCVSKVDIRLFGSQKDRHLYSTGSKATQLVTMEFVFDDGKMREEKMIQLAQQVATLFPNLYGFTVFYHPRLNHFFPLMLEQITTKSNIKLHMLNLGRAPKEPKWATKWWAAISLIPVLKLVYLMDPGELPPIIYENANRLVNAKVAQIIKFDWNLVPLFKQFASKLETLELQVNTRINCDLDELDRLLEENPRIGSNLTKLHFSCFKIDLKNSAEEQIKWLRLVVKRFPTLQVLHLKSMVKLQLEDILNEIAKLPKLEELCITAMLLQKYIPKSVDHLTPNPTVVRLRINNPIDAHINQFGRIIVPLFPKLNWIGVSSLERSNVEHFRAQLPLWYPDRERTKFQVIWHDGLRQEVFEDKCSPMDDPRRWIVFNFTEKGTKAIKAAIADDLGI